VTLPATIVTDSAPPEPGASATVFTPPPPVTVVIPENVSKEVSWVQSVPVKYTVSLERQSVSAVEASLAKLKLPLDTPLKMYPPAASVRKVVDADDASNVLKPTN
jgi:hypothetical protein